MSERLMFLEVVVLSVTILVSVGIAWSVARQTRKHFRIEHSRALIRRFNSTEMSSVRRDVDSFLESGGHPAQLAAGAMSTKEEAAVVTVRTLANFFQELGVAFKHKVVEEQYVWDVFGSLVASYWDRLWPYVDASRRESGRETLWEDFEKLALDMARIDQKRGVVREAPAQVSLFGYGSLLSLESFAEAVGHEVPEERVRPAWLNGYRRAWNVWDRVQLTESGRELPVAFLGIEPDPGARLNGVVVPFSADGLAGLDGRERSYNRVDVTDSLSVVVSGRVFTYVAKPEYRTLPDGSKVAQRYLELIRAGAASWGGEFVEAFEATTPEPGLPTVDGRYSFVETHPNPVGASGE